jgi:hypothetical protein
MAKKGAAAKPPAGALKRVVGAVVTVALLIVYPVFHANSVMEHALHNAFPGWEVTYKSTWPRLLGGASARDVTLQPYGDQDGQETFHFERVTIAIPFFEYYWSLTKGRKFLSAIHAVDMRFEGGSGNLVTPFSEGLDLIGNASLSLFDAEGCVSDHTWVDEELPAMGLPASPLLMQLSWSRADKRLSLHHRLSRAGIGRLEYHGERGVDDAVPLLGIYEMPLDEPASESWTLVDEGFTAARNRHCANKDGIDEATFVDRHLQAVRRVLESEGLAAGTTLEAAYRAFAREGGEFALSVDYPRMGGLRFEDDSVLGELVGHVTGNIVIRGQAIGLALRDVHARPFPEDSELTTYELLRREQGSLPPAETPVVATAATTAAPPTLAPAKIEQEEIFVPAAALAAPALQAVETEDSAVITDYRELGKHAGERYVVHFRSKSPMRVEILGMDGGAVRVRRNLPSGSAEHVLDRATFVRAERAR